MRNYNFARQSLDELGSLLEELQRANNFKDISRLEVLIRKKSEEAMVYVAMVPKDVANMSLNRKGAIRNDAMSVINYVKSIIDEPEETKTIEEKPVSKPKKGKKNGTSVRGKSKDN